MFGSTGRHHWYPNSSHCGNHHLHDKEVDTPSTNFRADLGAPKPKAAAGAQNYRPPMILTDSDPTTKKSNIVFGVDLGSEMDLRATLVPPNLPHGVLKGLANAMVDLIAISGVFCEVSTESDGDDMA